MKKATPVEKILQAQIQQIIQLNNRQSEDLYTICRLVTGIYDHSLFTQLGYKTFKSFCTEMLPFSWNMAKIYVVIRRSAVRLKYSQKEIIAIIDAHPLRLLARTLPQLRKKVGLRALDTLIQSTHAKQQQLNMWMSEKDINAVERELKLLGLEINKDGRRMNMSASIVALAKDHARLRRLVKKHKTSS